MAHSRVPSRPCHFSCLTSHEIFLRGYPGLPAPYRAHMKSERAKKREGERERERQRTVGLNDQYVPLGVDGAPGILSRNERSSELTTTTAATVPTYICSVKCDLVDNVSNCSTHSLIHAHTNTHTHTQQRWPCSYNNNRTIREIC